MEVISDSLRFNIKRAICNMNFKIQQREHKQNSLLPYYFFEFTYLANSLNTSNAYLHQKMLLYWISINYWLY